MGPTARQGEEMTMRTFLQKVMVLCMLLVGLAAGCLLLGGVCMVVTGSSPYDTIRDFTATWDAGVFSHDLVVEQQTHATLHQVRVEFTFFLEDGSKHTETKYWTQWVPQEAMRISVDAHRYQRVVLHGKAFKDGERVNIAASWDWNWK